LYYTNFLTFTKYNTTVEQGDYAALETNMTEKNSLLKQYTFQHILMLLQGGYKFVSIKKLVSLQIKKFHKISESLVNVLPPVQCVSNQDKLVYRINHLNQFVHKLPQNQVLREHLIAYGYHPNLWEDDILINVVVENKKKF